MIAYTAIKTSLNQWPWEYCGGMVEYKILTQQSPDPKGALNAHTSVLTRQDHAYGD